ncbi:uncharacterized protein LOC134211024 isoform X2 [Armigeres subalbatus]|uniref:uncharacterized protein LOC134211024 isoform X2 n=1 Tax=Armigeres subalbatus TaxID=124917 RepID=UPI002ED53D4A
MDIIDVEEVLGDDSFICDTERLDDEVVEIFKQWKSCSTTIPSGAGGAILPAPVPPASASGNSSNSSFSSSGINHRHLLQHTANISPHNATFNSSDSKGLKYIDTRTFTRPKKRLDSTFNASNTSADLTPSLQETSMKVASPLLNLQIGGMVTMTSGNSSLNTSQMMQRSWLNDVSPPGSIMSSMEFSINDKMGSSLITSGDFTNVSYLLNANGVDETQQLNAHSNYGGYKLADVIKDRKFLENLSCFDDNSMAKDLAISKTDLNGIEENLSGLSTMQNSLESVTKSAEGRLSDVTMVLENGKSDATFELEPAEVAPVVVTKLNGTFERRRNFDTYRKPKSSLNSTFDALPKVDAGRPLLVANGTFDAGSDDKVLDDSPETADATFSLNRTAKVNGEDKQLNQTYEYCEKNSPSVAQLNQTFERPKNGTYVENETSLNQNVGAGNSTPNGTFEIPTKGETSRDSMGLAQSTPFVQVPRAKRISDMSQYEVNVSPIAAVRGRRSEGPRLSRNLESEIAMETDDFDVEFRRLPATPNSKTENGSHLLETEKRISLQQFEEFEKSVMESEQNGVDFDEMLNSLTDVKRSMDSVKLRQSLDNIKKRHSRINSEKQQDELRKRGDMNDSLSSPMDNKLADSMIKSMSSSSGSERLLNRRSRYNDDVHLTLSPQQQTPQSSRITDASLHVSELQTNEPHATESVDPLPTPNEVGGSDRKNRDRFKTIRINKRREEGMVIVPDPDEMDDSLPESCSLPLEEEMFDSPTVTNSAFSRVDYNSPKDSRLSSTTSNEQNKTEEVVFKRPQGIPKPESKVRSLSKPRYYGAAPAGSGIGLTRKELSLPLGTKSSSSDNLENDRPSYHQQQSPSQLQRLSLGGNRIGAVESGRKFGAPSSVQSNLKSPMGTKSKSHHNLYYNQSNLGGSNSNLNRIPTPLGLSAQKLSHNNSNTELSGVQMRAPKAGSRLGLVRPSSGYFSYSSQKKPLDSDTESINSLSSSSASSRGSLYRVDSQIIANNVQNSATHSIEDISGSVNNVGSLGLRPSQPVETNRTAANLPAKNSIATSGLSGAKPSGLRPPSNLRPPTARSGLPRPTSYVRR